MDVRPLHDRIIVKRVESLNITPGGIHIPDSATKDKPPEAKVVAVGKGKILADGTIDPMRVKVGDMILFSQHSGTEMKIEGEDYLFLKEEEVIGIIEPLT